MPTSLLYFGYHFHDFIRLYDTDVSFHFVKGSQFIAAILHHVIETGQLATFGILIWREAQYFT